MRLRLLSFWFFIVGSVFAQTPTSNITVTPTLYPIFQEAEQVNANTLFIFDVDDVLIVSRNQIFLPPYVQAVKAYEEGIKQRHSEQEYYRIWSILRRQFHTRMVDTKIQDLIALLKQRHLKVIGLSSANAGAFGPIQHMEDLRLKELDREHIDFSDSFPNRKQIKFPSLQKLARDKRIPMFKGGVLFACKVPKGKVLKAFLDAMKMRPKKIVFTDDKIRNVESVRAFCRQAKIPFQGFHYTAIPTTSATPFNKKRADLQFKILEEEGRWLSDVETDKLLAAQ